MLNKSLPIFPKEHVVLKPKEQKLLKVTASSIDEISGVGIIKILDGSAYSIMLIKLKFTCNAAILDIVNNGMETIIFKPEEMIRIVDLRLLGYYKRKQGILQQNLIIVYTIEKFSYGKVRRFAKSIIKEWFENIPKEMSVD